LPQRTHTDSCKTLAQNTHCFIHVKLRLMSIVLLHTYILHPYYKPSIVQNIACLCCEETKTE